MSMVNLFLTKAQVKSFSLSSLAILGRSLTFHSSKTLRKRVKHTRKWKASSGVIETPLRTARSKARA